MHCCKNITPDLIWVGANDRRLAMFEGVYSVPDGVSYNSYVLLDEKTAVFDTVDKAVSRIFFENVEHALNGRKLDYLVVHHMEPDHSATMQELVIRYPDVKIVCNDKIKNMIKQFFEFDIDSRAVVVKEGDTLSLGKHELTFVMAPMVHWPEVMMSFEKTDKILFSADAFGSFGALNGAIFADFVDFEKDYLNEARRYYTNIVGKYGPQVQAVLKKASTLDIKMICPLHGFVWRKHLSDFIEKYDLWSSYTPEIKGVMVVYASVYGNTENTAEIIASKISDKGIPVTMFDVSVKPASDIVSAAFRYSHIVFASTTYNAGIFVSMEACISDIVAHNLQKRKIAIVENGSWAPTSGKLMREELSKLKNCEIIEQGVTIKSSLKEDNMASVDALVDALTSDIDVSSAEEKTPVEVPTASVDDKAYNKISYGLYVLTTKWGTFDNGCIINTVTQITSQPGRISIAVNKNNLSNQIIKETGIFNVSVLTEDANFDIFKKFGFVSGREQDKFTSDEKEFRTANGLTYYSKATNAVISAKVIDTLEYETHTVFVAEVTEAKVLSDVRSVTYQYYFDHIKPKPGNYEEKKKGWVCKICGYVYEGDELPEDYECPLCKHGPADFERIE
ncbi:MAG: flavin reductase [Clostridiales bacterium]|nr:flavin reductase [Clostridiales bacterium]